jgi:hypothetical protein
MVMRKILSAVFILIFLQTCAAAAQIEYNSSYLARYGVDFSRFKMATFSENGKVGVGLEKVNSLKLRIKGDVWILRIFKFDTYNRILGIKSVLLPVSDIDNIAVDRKGKIAVIISQYGTEFLKVNLQSGKIKILFKHTKGKPGFRAQIFLGYRDGNFIAQGYFYDSKGYWLSNAVAKLNLSHPNSSNFFSKTWNIGKTFKQLGNVKSWWIVSGSEGFIAAQKGEKVNLYHFDNGKITHLDTAKAYGGFAAANHRILYFALRPNGIRQTIIKDTLSGKTWILENSRTPYLYPYLSENGKIAVFALLNLKLARISFFYARQTDNFKVHPLKNLQNVLLGVFRLSGNGKRYSFQNKNGLFIGSLPSREKSSLPPPIY